MKRQADGQGPAPKRHRANEKPLFDLTGFFNGCAEDSEDFENTDVEWNFIRQNFARLADRKNLGAAGEQHRVVIDEAYKEAFGPFEPNALFK